jgi:hypothetical protein
VCKQAGLHRQAAPTTMHSRLLFSGAQLGPRTRASDSAHTSVSELGGVSKTRVGRVSATHGIGSRLQAGGRAALAIIMIGRSSLRLTAWTAHHSVDVRHLAAVCKDSGPSACRGRTCARGALQA